MKIRLLGRRLLFLNFVSKKERTRIVSKKKKRKKRKEKGK
jgi:hypothetical protein